LTIINSMSLYHIRLSRKADLEFHYNIGAYGKISEEISCGALYTRVPRVIGNLLTRKTAKQVACFTNVMIISSGVE
jgi:hypothetical protein